MAGKKNKKVKAAYTASGAVESPKYDLEIGSSIAPKWREVVPILTSRPQQVKMWDTMARTDAVTSVSLRAAKTPVLGAEFYIDPGADDPQAEMVGEFVRFSLFEGMTHPWSMAMIRALRCYQYGNSILEPVWEARTWAPRKSGSNQRNYTMLRKLAYRPPTTIEDIERDDNGGPLQIIQNAVNADGTSRQVTIPIEKAIIFTYGDTEDIFGESILRTAYPHYYYKNYLYKIDGIQKERHGTGVPVGKLPPGYSPADKDAMDELLSNIRTNERGHLTLPPGYEVAFAKVEGNLVDVLKSATHHDMMILLNVMAEFMMSGMGENGGSRATAGSQTDIFYKSSLFIANMLCDFFNLYLIPNLVLYNFETDVIPKLKVRSIGQAKDLQMLGAALSNLFSQDIITPDMETENWARTLLDMPTKKEPRPVIDERNFRENINQNTNTTTYNGAKNGQPNGTTSISGGAGRKGTGNTGKGPTQT